MTEMRKVEKKDIERLVSICEVKLYGSETQEESEFFADCEISASERSECVVIKVKNTNSAIKVKKTSLLKIMGYSCDHKKFTERI